MQLMLLTHFDLGAVLLRCAHEILGSLPFPVYLLNVDNQISPEKIRTQALELLETVPQECPVLILTDLYGSTPHNIAQSLDTGHTIKIVSGVNLPMLLRLFNYAHLSFEKNVIRAVEGAEVDILTNKQNILPNKPIEKAK